MNSTPRPWLRWSILVTAAALLAHGGCLGATFYLDDWTQIVDCDAVDQGRWLASGQRALTYLTYDLTYRAAGTSAVAFHAGNLLLHVAVSLALLGFARDFLTDAAGLPPGRALRIGGWGAVLFAVHPLCSEMPNYARARDIGLVSLFSLLAAWAALRWRRDGAWRWVALAFAAMAAAAFSKEVGLPLAVGTAALVIFGVRRGDGMPAKHRPQRRAVWLAGGAALCLSGAVFASRLLPLLSGTARQSWRDTRLGWHVLTQARVFWMYLARVAWPAGLCSDHQIAWTASRSDAVAWVAAGAQTLVVCAALAALCQRRPAVRAAGVLAVVALLDIMHRLANVSAELMVEYRMYPAMLPICVLLAWGLDRLRGLAAARWPRLPSLVPRAVLGVVVAAGAATSARRTLDWHRPDRLVANVVAQYPYNARARQELQEADIRAGRWEAVVSRLEGIRQAFDGAAAFNAAHPTRKYDMDELTMTRIISEGNAALGLAREGHRADAFARLTYLHTVMDNNHLTLPLYWSAYYYTSALVHDTAGERADAVDDLRISADLGGGPAPYVQRQLRRYQAGEPLP